MKMLFKALKYSFKLSPGAILWNLLYTVCKSAIPFVFLFFSGRIVDALINGNIFDEIMRLVIMMAVISLVLGVLAAISNELAQSGMEHIDINLKRILTEKSLKLPISLLEKKDIKELLQKAEDGSNGSGSLANFAILTLGTLLNATLSIIYAISLFSICFTSIDSNNEDIWFKFFNNPFSFLVIIVAVTIVLIITFFVMKKAAKLSYAFYESNVETNRRMGYFDSIVTSDEFAKDIRVYNMGEMIDTISEKESIESAERYEKFTNKTIKYEVILALASAILLLISYLFVGGKAYYGIITVGAIITVVGAISNFATSLFSLINQAVEAKTMLKYLRYYFDYIELPEDVENGKNVPEGDLVIAFEDVYYKYDGSEDYALNGVSFVIKPHNKTAIVGPNGAGKSTIIKLIARFYKPEKGRITINGIDINEIDGEEYQKILGILFQDFSLFDFSVGQNVSSLLEYDENKVKESLDLVGFNYNNAKKLPNGLNTFIGNSLDDGVDFSGGEKQKIAIARALYKNPPIILLDEPTSALDPKSELEVYTSIAKLTDKKTALFISHRMSSTNFCDNIIVLEKGKIVQEGNHEKLIKEEGLYSRLFNEQAKYYI